jgi:hypothetical protein
MHNLKTLQDYAKKYEGKCLSDKYITNATLYKWVCKNNHEFEKTWTTLLRSNSTFCTKCKNNIIDQLKLFAVEKNGKLLSENYITSNSLYKWECKNSHIFEKSWTEMKRASWFCIKCNKDNEITIDKLKKFAKEKNGECISEKYINSNTNYEWKCENFHTWKATWVNVGYNNATWCKKCNEWTFEKIQKYVSENKNGKCLKIISGYGIDGRYLFECDDFHQWETNAGNIIYRDTWCASCLKLTIEDCFYEAEKRGGKCLDTVYINKRTDINWECHYGHRFKCPLGPVKHNNRWCKECAIIDMKLDIDEAHKIALEREGKCVTETYINCDTRMEWICKEGHNFHSTLTDIKRGNWCQTCSIIQRRLKSIARIEDWLLSFNGKLLSNKNDIDFKLNPEEIKLAFECENSHRWEKTMDRINYDSHCQTCSIIQRRSKSVTRIEDWLLSFNGKLLTNKEDIDFELRPEEIKLAFECENSHRWERTMDRINYDSHCQTCSIIQRRSKSLTRIEDWLLTFNGKLLTNKEDIDFELRPEEIKLAFECENSHCWERTMDRINYYSQCPYCTIIQRRIKAINKLEEWINSLNGYLLSDTEEMLNYSGNFNEIDIKVKCHKGHIWSRTIEVFRNKTWCPDCRFKSESACRNIFEDLFGIEFPKRRLKFLNYLELDGYCEAHKIAFEYNGLQHEQYIRHFHRNGIQDFFKQQNRDKIKYELCKKNNITLINIPSQYTYTNLKKLRKFIIEEMENNGIIIL